VTKRIKKLINRWWAIRSWCDSDEHMLALIFSELQGDPDLFEKLTEGLEHRKGR